MTYCTAAMLLLMLSTDADLFVHGAKEAAISYFGVHIHGHQSSSTSAQRHGVMHWSWQAHNSGLSAVISVVVAAT